MYACNADQTLPVHSLDVDSGDSNKLFRMFRAEGKGPYYRSDFLLPHRKDYYLLVFVKHGGCSRHWVDMKPYVLKEDTFYFTVPHQVHVKEDPKPFWGTSMAFTNEFLALQESASLRKLPLILNPHNGHELLLTNEDIAFVEDMLDKLHMEYHKPGHWQQRMLTAYLQVLLTYLSRLYTEQFKGEDASAEKLLLKRYQGKIEERFREMHEVSEYASLLNISAGHLSEVVKVQSGKPAITHIHERLILEARRMLFHTDNSVKEIAFDLGFSDASYFSRFFKRETSITPAGYRVNVRKMYH